ncbi:hypothetical protein GCM10027063_48150 [Promicromonospora xylanilytica]
MRNAPTLTAGATGPLGNRTPLTDTHMADERREAARVLIMHPILTSATHPEELALVRRHSAALKRQFQIQLGYRLIVETGFARLVKHPLSPDVPHRGARRLNGNLLTPRAYTCLALLCAGLLAPGGGEQILISALVERLRTDAAGAGITVTDEHADRRAIVVALTYLINWGLLTETDGSVAAWGERKDEALLSVNRGLLPHLLARPLANLTGPEALWEPDPDAVEQPRRDLRRQLVENPLVRREALTDAEADALSRERRDIAAVLDDLLGLTLEVRAEGALAYDDGEEFSDLRFPGQGTTRQAALLLIDAATDKARPAGGTIATVAGEDVPGLLVVWPSVTEELEDLARRHAKAWRNDTKDIDGFQRAVVGLLAETGLARVTEDGLVLHPACARYRPVPEHHPSRSRTNIGLGRAGGPDTGSTGEPDSLFTLHPELPLPDNDA